MGNRALLEQLFEKDLMGVRRGPIFDIDPGPMPADFDFDRIEGMLLGLAIGDSLGNTTESWLPAVRRATHGEVRDYLPKHGQPISRPSDDTQMAFWAIEQLLADGGLDPAHLAARFCRDHIYGIGKSVKEFIGNYKHKPEPWYAAAPRSAGNGALMRIAPMLIPHLRTGTADLWADTALSARVTHYDPASTAACVAFVNLLWQALQMAEAPKAEWWLDTFTGVAQELEGDTDYRPSGGKFKGYRGPIWHFVEEKVSDAYRRNRTVLEACNAWYSGAFLMETIPSVIYILMRHAHDPETAIVRAVNDTKDNDTVAAIVGAAAGALHGRRKLPRRWITGLSGRTSEDDDGRVFELIDAARTRWWR